MLYSWTPNHKGLPHSQGWGTSIWERRKLPVFITFRSGRSQIQIQVPRLLLITIHHVLLHSFIQQLFPGHILCARYWWRCWSHCHGHSSVLREWTLTVVTLECVGWQSLHQHSLSTPVTGTKLGPITLLFSGKATWDVIPVLSPGLTHSLSLRPLALMGTVWGGVDRGGGAGMAWAQALKTFTPKSLGHSPQINWKLGKATAKMPL